MACKNQCSISDEEIESAITKEKLMIREKFGDFFSGENVEAYITHRKTQLPELLREEKTMISGIEKAFRNAGSPETIKVSLIGLLDKALDYAEMCDSGKIPALPKVYQWKLRLFNKDKLRAGARGMLHLANQYLEDAFRYGFLDLPEFKGLMNRYTGLKERVGGLQE